MDARDIYAFIIVSRDLAVGRWLVLEAFIAVGVLVEGSVGEGLHHTGLEAGDGLSHNGLVVQLALLLLLRRVSLLLRTDCSCFKLFQILFISLFVFIVLAKFLLDGHVVLGHFRFLDDV